jgi:hypothetical protein
LSLFDSTNPLPYDIFRGTQPMACGLFGPTEMMTLSVLKTILMMLCWANWPNATMWTILLEFRQVESRKHNTVLSCSARETGRFQDFLSMMWARCTYKTSPYKTSPRQKSPNGREHGQISPVKFLRIYYMYIVSNSFFKKNIILNTFPYFPHF